MTSPATCVVYPNEFKGMLATIEGQTLASGKLVIAKQILTAKECFNVTQIGRILDAFTFESNKLELAKFAQAYCINPTDYYKLNNDFEFGSSVKELRNFIDTGK
jgi:hypothetical protein